MGNDERSGLVDTLFAPLTVPQRAVKDLEALGAAARSIPSFERELLAELGQLGADVQEIEDGLAVLRELARDVQEMKAQVTAIEAGGHVLLREVTAMRDLVSELRAEVGDAVEHLPDPDAPGPIARARDALTGNGPSEGD
jgi:hypothetical protein